MRKSGAAFITLILAIIIAMGAIFFAKNRLKKADSSTNLEQEESTGKVIEVETQPDPLANIFEGYLTDDNVNQILVVKSLGGSNANATYFVKNTDKKEWNCIFNSTAYVGKNGIDKEGEGDGKTPTGEYGITTAFGILDNPGVRINYINITDSIFACDEEGDFYNQIIDTNKVEHKCNGEHMIELSPYYDYGIATDYNKENVYPKGSAIFIHCKGEKEYTGGCVALDKKDMLTVMTTAEQGMRIIIF